MKNYVLGFAFKEKIPQWGDDVLLIRKNRPAFQNGLLNGIGGKVELDDISPLHAMMREFAEETGLVTGSSHWRELFAFGGKGDSPFHIDVFLGTGIDIDKARAITDETIHLRCSDLCQVTDRYIGNLNWIVPLLLDQSHSNVPQFYIHST